MTWSQYLWLVSEKKLEAGNVGLTSSECFSIHLDEDVYRFFRHTNP